jgi:8-oxo-dGTP pyrophosphatase MutT (NUDIX family)
LLLIKRGEREGDPWSGQVAFPGGRSEPGDKNLFDTAVRETEEEMSVDLRRESTYLGSFGPFKAHTKNIYVTACVFLLKNSVSPQTHGEIFSYQWVPMTEFQKEGNKSTLVLERKGQKMEFPSFTYKGYVIWGLTHRILTTFLDFQTDFRL